MDVIDPAAVDTWPAEVVEHVRWLADRCRAVGTNRPATPSYELSLGHVDEGFAAETEFRSLFAERLVALFHATRLLPHEIEAIRSEGLVVLSREHSTLRFDRLVEMYGDEVGSERLAALRDAGPLAWDRGSAGGRLGKIHRVTPLKVAFAEGGTGMTVFLNNWGGEAVYRVGKDEELLATLHALGERSHATIVAVAVAANTLNTYTSLWRVFVGQLDGWDSPWHEFSTEESILPQRVLDLIGETSARWPADIGPLRTP